MPKHYLGKAVKCEDGVREFALDKDTGEFIYRFWGKGVPDPDPNWIVTDMAYLADMGLDTGELPILSGCKIR